TGRPSRRGAADRQHDRLHRTQESVSHPRARLLLQQVMKHDRVSVRAKRWAAVKGSLKPSLTSRISFQPVNRALVDPPALESDGLAVSAVVALIPGVISAFVT